MKHPTSGPGSQWDDLTCEGSRNLLLQRSLQAAPAQRLEWLEEMLELAWRSREVLSSREKKGQASVW